MQRYFSKKKEDNYFILDENDIRHIKLVMRMGDNEKIEVVFDNEMYICCLENVKDNIKIKIINKEENKTFVFPKINLIIPILKEQKMDYILQKSTELGVYSITPIFTERTIVKIDSKEYEKRILRWQKIVKEASEQSKRNDIPIINQIINLKDIKQTNDINIVCSTIEQKNNIKNMFQNIKNCDTINVVIGPEGGLSINEEQFLNKQGFISTSLGTRILRVETVPMFILSVFNYIYME